MTITVAQIKEKLQKGFTPQQSNLLAEVFEDVSSDTVKAGDFNELKDIVKRLAIAQEELVEAQKRTEQRVEELADAQKELADAQKELADAQKELTDAQKNTEKSIKGLARQVGGLSETVGGDIEDIAYIVLHEVLKREFGWQVSPLERAWRTWDGEEIEINVFGKAFSPEAKERIIWIIGEAKHNFSMRELNRFVKLVKKARVHLEGDLFPVCFCYRARPEVQEAIKELGFRLVFSYGKII